VLLAAYAPAMDNLITAADVARNNLDGLMNGSVRRWRSKRLLQDGADFVLLDVPHPG